MTHLTPEALQRLRHDLAHPDPGPPDEHPICKVYQPDLEALISAYEAMREALKTLTDTVRAELDVEPCVGSMAPVEHALGVARAALPQPEEGPDK